MIPLQTAIHNENESRFHFLFVKFTNCEQTSAAGHRFFHSTTGNSLILLNSLNSSDLKLDLLHLINKYHFHWSMTHLQSPILSDSVSGQNLKLLRNSKRRIPLKAFHRRLSVPFLDHFTELSTAICLFSQI